MCEDFQSGEKTCLCLFEYLGRHPGPWWLSSLRLKAAAETLRRNCWPDKRKHHDINIATADFHVGPVYMLLMGMAVEAGLKAILVAENPDLVGTKEISKTIGHHHLTRLWNIAGLDRVRCPQRDSLLDRLENCLVIFGRYPIPKNSDGFNKMRNSSFQGQLHFEQVNRLWARVERHVRETIPQLFDEITVAQPRPGISNE